MLKVTRRLASATDSRNGNRLASRQFRMIVVLTVTLAALLPVGLSAQEAATKSAPQSGVCKQAIGDRDQTVVPELAATPSEPN